MKFSGLIGLILLLFSVTCAVAEPDPGPADKGLRLRLIVSPTTDALKEGFNVRVDLINSGASNITLHAGWTDDSNEGDLKDYIEATTSIESYPPIRPCAGQVGVGFRKSPQPKHVLEPGEVLSVSWQTVGRRLKNKVLDPNAVQNPEFPFPGLYSVHATLKLYVGDAPAAKTISLPGSPKESGPTILHWPEKNVFLRSNEQLVPVGGSRELPKFTYGELWTVRKSDNSADLSLGAFHKIQKGDEFKIQTGMREFWKLTVSSVSADFSRGQLEPIPIVLSATNLSGIPPPTNTVPKFPSASAPATLTAK